MTEHRFDGRVALVTGAGRGLGRAYALLLAERGAKVVVNDLGGSVEGTGADASPADEVVAEIGAAGGEAAADTSDIATEDGAARLVATAGIMRWGRFPDVDREDLERHLHVHVGGSFFTARAVWPHLVEQGYGRIVMTTSTGMLGLPGSTVYAAAKGGVLGLGRSLATAGAPHGIKVNLIAPAASTRMAGDVGPDMPPEQVAPMVALLAHEDCPVTGEVYTAGGGRFARLFLASTPGYVHDGPAPTVEDVAAQWATINDEAGYDVPADLMSWSMRFLEHLL